jgi:anti-sigma factor RsiW
MSDHEQVSQLLALSAAGMLDAGEERLVRQHARQCTACAAELEEFAALSAELSALPVPQAPADLVLRTSALMAAEADRREGSIFAGAAAIFACVCVLLTAQILRMLVGDSAVLLWLVWVGISSVLGTASAMLLASRRRLERRIV